MVLVLVRTGADRVALALALARELLRHVAFDGHAAARRLPPTISWPLIQDTASGSVWSTYVSTLSYEMSYPEEPGVLRIVRGFL